MKWPWKRKDKPGKSPDESVGGDPDYDDIKGMSLTSANIRKIFSLSKDVHFKEIYINSHKGIKATAVFIEGMVDNKSISEFILNPLINDPIYTEASSEKEIIHNINKGHISYPAQNTRTDIMDAISDILSGNLALVFDGTRTAFTFKTQGFEKRSITEPLDENVIKGAKDSFVETLQMNTATVRRKIKSHHLVIEERIVGEQTRTPVAIIYMANIANSRIVNEVKKRVESIDIDGVLTTSFINDFLIKHQYAAFPQVDYTERTDRFCANIIEGRVGLIVDGIATSLILPVTLLQFIQAPDDFSQRYIVGSIKRLLRFIMMLTTLFLPGLYAAITTYHHEMMPTELAISIQNSKEGVPFPSSIEVIGMLVAFEILIEGGLRLPKTIGQAVSIVGAVVVGQAAVSAKLVSPAVLVAVSITAIAGFTMPNQDFSNALRIWRFALVILSSVLGLFGLSMGGLFLLFQLGRMEDYGVPYLSPFAGSVDAKFEDTVFRLPIKFLRERPNDLRTINTKRQGRRGQ